MPLRVLVCDDERHIARLIQVNLERQGYKVTCSFDYREALDKLEDTEPIEEGRFQMVIIDYLLPKGDAYGLLEWIRTHESMKDAWVAVMIPDSARDDWRHFPYQPNLYLSKPFNPIDLAP